MVRSNKEGLSSGFLQQISYQVGKLFYNHAIKDLAI